MKKSLELASAASRHVAVARQGWVLVKEAVSGAAHRRRPSPSEADLAGWKELAEAYHLGWDPAPAVAAGDLDGADMWIEGWDACELTHAGDQPPAPVYIYLTARDVHGLAPRREA